MTELRDLSTIEELANFLRKPVATIYAWRSQGRGPKGIRLGLHSWTFAQLGQFIAYKAVRAGLPVVYVDPAYTSQGCSSCGHVSRKNRQNQATFCCTSCGFPEHADVNAARNIASRGAMGWAEVMRPHAA